MVVAIQVSRKHFPSMQKTAILKQSPCKTWPEKEQYKTESHTKLVVG